MCIQYMYQLSGNRLNVYNTPHLSQLLVKFSHSQANFKILPCHNLTTVFLLYSQLFVLNGA